MSHREGPKGQSSSFLQRFEGKKTAVTKEGLVYLFDSNLKKANPEVPARPVYPNSIQPDRQLVSKLNFQDRARDIIRSGSEIHRDRSQSPSSRLSYRTEILKKEAVGVEKNQLALPKLMNNRFNNSHQQLMGSRSQRQGTLRMDDAWLGRKGVADLRPTGPMGSGKMDSNALQHLQFLNKLQQRWIHLKNR